MASFPTCTWPQCTRVPHLAPSVTVTQFPRNANDRRRIRATASSSGKSGGGSAGGRGGGREGKGGDAEWVTGGSWFEFDTDSLAVTSAPPDDDVSLTGDTRDTPRPSDPKISAKPSAGEGGGSGRQDPSDAGGSASRSAAGGRLGGRLGGRRGGRTGGDRGAWGGGRGGGRSGGLKDAELAEIMAAVRRADAGAREGERGEEWGEELGANGGGGGGTGDVERVREVHFSGCINESYAISYRRGETGGERGDGGERGGEGGDGGLRTHVLPFSSIIPLFPPSVPMHSPMPFPKPLSFKPLSPCLNLIHSFFVSPIFPHPYHPSFLIPITHPSSSLSPILPHPITLPSTPPSPASLSAIAATETVRVPQPILLLPTPLHPSPPLSTPIPPIPNPSHSPSPASLSAIAATATVRVPQPIATGDFRTASSSSSSSSPPSSATTPSNEAHRGSFIIMEHLQLRPFAMMDPANQEQLGRSLAQLHLVSSAMPGVQFGFNSPTRLGVMPLVNTPLSSSWSRFFLTHRLQDRLDRVLARFGDEARELQDIVPSLVEASERILTTEAMADVRPSLLHGDLWVGNAGVLRSGEAVMFDPAGFFGHSEFDLAFQGWKPAPGFPGFSDSFYDAYHQVIPRAAGFEERQSVYQLFHLLNHVLILLKEGQWCVFLRILKNQPQETSTSPHLLLQSDIIDLILLRRLEPSLQERHSHRHFSRLVPSLQHIPTPPASIIHLILTRGLKPSLQERRSHRHFSRSTPSIQHKD
ncbi:unnamed protein product, partial [Closterium sp. Naga37s-1]